MIEAPETNHDESWRNDDISGYSGFDYVHSRSKSAVCILDYAIKTDINANNRKSVSLVGLVHFSKYGESHRGFIHGGAFCALVDDAVGWLGFSCVEDGKVIPWSGYTVQIDTSLKRPVPIGSLLKLEATLENQDRRKVWSNVKLTDEEGNVYCEGKGLFLINKDYLSI